MESKVGRVFNVEPKYISNPEDNEFVTIYRNKLDNKYYGRRADGTDEPLAGNSISEKSVIIPSLNVLIKNPILNTPSIQRPEIRMNWNPIQISNGSNSFLNYNPEIWLFRYKRAKGNKYKGIINRDRKKSSSRFIHPVHLEGIKYPNSKFYGGGGISIGGGKSRKTEFNCPLNPYETIKLDINYDDYCSIVPVFPFNSDGSKNDLATKYKLIGRGRSDTRAMIFKFAIVIDNPDNTSQYKKIFGPLTESINVYPFGIKIVPGLYQYVNFVARLQTSTNIINIK